ncbi:MAG: hypothetical protein AB3N11_08700 [Arenibacterium sp.]
MTTRLLIALAALSFAAACEPERGAGFTGIGSKNATIAYDLNVTGNAPSNN